MGVDPGEPPGLRRELQALFPAVICCLQPFDGVLNGQELLASAAQRGYIGNPSIRGARARAHTRPPVKHMPFVYVSV